MITERRTEKIREKQKIRKENQGKSRRRRESMVDKGKKGR